MHCSVLIEDEIPEKGILCAFPCLCLLVIITSPENTAPLPCNVQVQGVKMFLFIMGSYAPPEECHKELAYCIKCCKAASGEDNRFLAELCWEASTSAQPGMVM